MLSRIASALAITIVTLCAATAHAIPQLINYQGVLTDGGGMPITVPTSVQFRIFDAAAGGTQQWTETQSVTPDAEGRFSVLLGSVTPIPDVALDQANAYLGLTISPDPEMTPRTRLVAVAYAFRPGTVDGATGGTITGDVAVTAGNIELDQSSDTAGNILKSGALFIHNRGTTNTFIGLDAGNLTMTGTNNTGTGNRSLRSNTTGFDNSAYGSYALYFNTTGFNNSAFGTGALYSNATGDGNSAFGVNALHENTTGTGNCAFGRTALQFNTTGTDNSAFGRSALFSNTAGFSNSAFGRNALLNNTTGNDNTAYGDSALFSNTTTSGSVAVGARALKLNTGFGNTAIGTEALRNNTVGNANTASGYQALLDVTIGGANTANGYNALGSTTTGGGNTAVGKDAMSTNTTGTGNTAVGFNTGVSANNLTNATVIGANATVNASNKIRLGDAAVTVIEGQVAFTASSDRNAKENFREVDGDEVLQKIRDLDVQTWNYKGHDPENFRHYGPVAQDFYAAFGRDEIGAIGTPTTINSGDMAGILMIAVQALEKRTAQNEDFKKRIEVLEKQAKARY